jgi:hypothetical protein
LERRFTAKLTVFGFRTEESGFIEWSLNSI